MFFFFEMYTDDKKPRPNIPIKNYGGKYMPDATQPTGYVPGPVAMNIANPAIVVGNQVRKDMMDRPFASGTLQDAYLKGAPGIAKPITPDVVRPAVHPMDFYTL